MQIKTPKFWYRELNSPAPWIERILWPVSAIYEAGHRLNLSRQSEINSPIPVLCVGNIVTGGSGKTPTLLAIQKLILQQAIAKNPFFLSRGYGGSETGPHCVDPAHDTTARVGDEPLLLARAGQALVSQNRAEGVKMGHSLGADIILMDDGFQNRSVAKDISLLVIDGASGFGNHKLLPSGPLREPIADGLARADAVILIGADERNIKAELPSNLPVFQANIKSGFAGEKNNPYIAFCGLACPEKFQKTLAKEKLNILKFYDYPDHHSFTTKELEKLLQESREQNAILITTEKDFVRIPTAFSAGIKILPIEIIFEDPSGLATFLKIKLERQAA